MLIILDLDRFPDHPMYQKAMLLLDDAITGAIPYQQPYAVPSFERHAQEGRKRLDPLLRRSKTLDRRH